MKNKNVVVKKDCHSQMFLLGISHIRFREWVKQFKQVGDPRQNSSGMTPLCNHGGFTLIELLVVVLIIGILAAVAVPQYKVAVAKSRYATLKHLVKSIAQAQETYYLANGKYAEKLEDLDMDLPLGDDPEHPDNAFLRYYKWGYCQLGKSIDTERNAVICRRYSGGLNIAYQIVGNHVSNATWKGKRSCFIYDDAEGPTLSTKICQIDTRITQPVSTSGGVTRYDYP